nr:membrane lipoprotein lipid attachment site-containing protein [Klebsiella pneumoniae]
MKKIFASIVLVLTLSGCSNSPKPNGTCALSSHGVCLLTWVDGEQVPSGEIDLRYGGLQKNGKEISGTVNVHKTKQWDIKK